MIRLLALLLAVSAGAQTLPEQPDNPADSEVAEYLDQQIRKNRIVNDSIDTPKIATDAVSAPKILAGAVDTNKIAAGSINTTKMLQGVQQTNKIVCRRDDGSFGQCLAGSIINSDCSCVNWQ